MRIPLIFLLVLSSLILLLSLVPSCKSPEEMGIHQTLNGQAVVLCGESITINAGSERSNEEIIADFNTLLATRILRCGPIKADMEIPTDLTVMPIGESDGGIAENAE